VDDFLARLELAFERRLDVLGQLVNDLVFANRNAPRVGQMQGLVVGHHVEANDDRIFRRSECQLHVALGDRADAGVQHANAHFLVNQLFKFLANGFH
jgi:hypothetical protein